MGCPFHCMSYDYFCADWDGLCNNLRDIPREDVFKLSFSAAASEFHEWIQVGVYVYIPSWFSVACAATMIHRNYVFLLHQQNKSSESKVKFRQTSNCSKRVLEAVKLAYANKTKEFIPSQKLGFGGFGQIANSAFSRGK